MPINLLENPYKPTNEEKIMKNPVFQIIDENLLNYSFTENGKVLHFNLQADLIKLGFVKLDDNGELQFVEGRRDIFIPSNVHSHNRTGKIVEINGVIFLEIEVEDNETAILEKDTDSFNEHYFIRNTYLEIYLISHNCNYKNTSLALIQLQTDAKYLGDNRYVIGENPVKKLFKFHKIIKITKKT